MKQVYITAVPLQGKGGLLSNVYHSEIAEWDNRPDTHFPIITVIANTLESAKNAQVIALCSKGEKAQVNFSILKDELSSYGINEEQISVVEIGDFSNQKEMLSMLLRIMDAIPSNSLIYSDITYQTKPVSATLITAMNMVEDFKNNTVQVEGIYYGEIHRDPYTNPKDENGELISASIYDITAMKTLADVASQLKSIGVNDVRGLIDKMIYEA